MKSSGSRLRLRKGRRRLTDCAIFVKVGIRLVGHSGSTRAAILPGAFNAPITIVRPRGGVAVDLLLVSDPASVSGDAGVQYIGSFAPPPVTRGKDLDLAVAGETLGLDPATNARNVDDTITHHAAVFQ